VKLWKAQSRCTGDEDRQSQIKNLKPIEVNKSKKKIMSNPYEGDSITFVPGIKGTNTTGGDGVLGSLLNRTQYTSEDASSDCRVDFIQSDPSGITQLEEHSLFVLHPMWAEKGDLL
jgi:hypothetical protein